MDAVIDRKKYFVDGLELWVERIEPSDFRSIFQQATDFLEQSCGWKLESLDYGGEDHHRFKAASKEELLSQFENQQPGIYFWVLNYDHKRSVWLREESIDRKLTGRYELEIVLYNGYVDSLEIPSAFLNACHQLCQQFIRINPKLTYTMKRMTNSFFPCPPLAQTRIQLQTITHADIAAAYDHPEDFLSTWDTRTDYGDHILLTRGLNKADNLAYKRDLHARQWKLAYAAKPGLTEYYYPNPDPDELELYDELCKGDQTVRTVGYDATTKTMEFTAFVEPDRHITPHEIFMLRDIVEIKEFDDDGELLPVETVRVVFPNLEMAEQEKRPLIDSGAVVIYLDFNGKDMQLKD